MKTYTITVIPGDGIGKEVVPEGLRVLEAVAAKFGFGFRFRHFEWSCESYKATGRMMPEECHHKGTGRGHRELDISAKVTRFPIQPRPFTQKLHLLQRANPHVCGNIYDRSLHKRAPTH